MAFLNRPLKRTISHGSTSTFRTVASVEAPSIPPVDVRPNFAASLGVQPGRRPSNLPAPSLPTVVGSPRPNAVSIIYEDSDKSFITAPSARASGADMDVDVDLEQGSDESESDIGTATDPFDDRHEPGVYIRHEGTEHSHMSLSSDLFDMVELTPIHPTTNTAMTSPWVGDQGSIRQHPTLGDEESVLETISRGSDTSVVTAVALETAIRRRWRLGLSFGSYRTDREKWEDKADATGRTTLAFVLFWLGFVAPWCWLIGGWHLSRSGELEPDGQFLHTVEWYWPRKRGSSAKGVVKPSKENVKSRRTLSPFWKSSGQAQETLPMSPLDSRASVISIRSLARLEHTGVNPWVTRCRVAAVTSGILLSAAVIVALVVVAGVRA
jgi:hypothetical protein